MSEVIQTISVFGLGKLGACITATLASRGFNVIGIDSDPSKVRLINAGIAPVQEPKLDKFMAGGYSRLEASWHVTKALDTDASFFVTPTPSLPDDTFSNAFLSTAMEDLARELLRTGKKGHLFVCCSTTTPNSCDEVLIPLIEKITGWKCGTDFGFCYNPQFIALGDVINGLLSPDLVLIGESDSQWGDALQLVYSRYLLNKLPISRMSLVSAELTKIALNSFITMKISFTNQIRLIANQFPKANTHNILEAIGKDSRIGPKYLRPGLSYGGPCFPRDNRMLAAVAKKVNTKAPLAEASDQVNEWTKEALLKQVEGLVTKGDLIAILGLAYKPHTHITEESPGIYLATQLTKRGHNIVVHDCATEKIPTNLALVKVAVICCPWPQYAELKFSPATIVISPWDN